MRDHGLLLVSERNVGSNLCRFLAVNLLFPFLYFITQKENNLILIQNNKADFFILLIVWDSKIKITQTLSHLILIFKLDSNGSRIIAWHRLQFKIQCKELSIL